MVYQSISLAVRVFANGPGDHGSISGRVIPKTKKMVLDAYLLSTQHYNVRIKGKVEQSWEKNRAFPIPWCSRYWKGAFRSPSTKVANFTYLYILFFTILLVEWFILTTSQPGWVYFISRGLRIAYIVCLYLPFLCGILGFCMWLYDIMYLYLVLIIFTQIYLAKRWDPN